MKQHLSMRTISFLLFHFIFFIQNTNSQNQEDSYSSQDSVTNFQPSVAVVIGMLSVVFTLTFVLLLYAKFCHRQSPGSGAAEQTRDWLVPSRTHASGTEKTVIESLPFFRFSMLMGSREGLECAVCLSKFDDIEILRLLPKCKHAFHVDCIDNWLEKHSSCPLCRQKVGRNDLSQMAYSNSFRFLWNQTESREESSLEVCVQREEDHSRSSFEKGKNKEEDIISRPIQESTDSEDQNKLTLHRFNHKIVVSDASVVIKNRWSNVSPSDIMSLNSEMINDVTSSRFTFPDSGNDIRITNTQQEMGKFERKYSTSDSYKQNYKNSGFDSKAILNTNKRSMSEIIVHPRSIELGNVRDHTSFVSETNTKEERMTRLWLPIARKTMHSLANRETKAPHTSLQT
ncbi:E3 ubiquitin-protein ligase ATL42-like [Primulina huaijiensis]|uniref:E3 ubiquitin-protein ligase ATL42-like n=1 Tax=Primulina huaijiensis TaxID=1492673 RepID=UPI003CC74DFC